ncbi:MAG: NAD(P)-dependent oxidoreductase [Balneolaceae bacterium]
MENEKLNSRTIERVFVTGASGFIGSALVDLLSRQELDIRCLVNKSPLTTNSTGVGTVQGNLINFEWRFLEGYKPDIIYHFARIPGRTKKERQHSAIQNAKANERLINWLQNQQNPPLLVFGSGTLVYGNHGSDWVNESAEVHPVSFQREYFEAERPVLQALKQKGLPINIVRPPWIYGTGSWFEWFFWKHMQEKKAVPLYSDGQNYMSLIHIDDCAGLIHHIGKYGEAGEIYNITSHAPIRQRKFTEQLQTISELPIKKYSGTRLWWQFSREAREALTFSLKSTTKHNSLFEQYQYKYPDLEAGLQSIFQRLKFSEGN